MNSDESLPCSILLVDDEPSISDSLSILLSDEYRVFTAESALAAQEVFRRENVDMILSDQKMPGISGVQLLEWVRKYHPKTLRLMMTGFAELNEVVDAINRGEVFRFLFKPCKTEELKEILRGAARLVLLERQNTQLLAELKNLNAKLTDANTTLEARVSERTNELRVANANLEQKNKVLEKLALTDPLTNLPTRRAMDRLADRELRRRQRHPSPLSIGIIDVDHFKMVNERYLLPGGDRVLIELSRILANSVRTIDFLGRVGGEEFMVLAPDTDMEGATILGERIRQNVADSTIRYKNHVIPTRVSIGFAVVESDRNADFETMRLLAAAALSEAKQSGRNRCVYYDFDKNVQGIANDSVRNPS